LTKMYLNNYNYTMNKIHNCGLYKNNIKTCQEGYYDI
jgi:hypothetical protein